MDKKNVLIIAYTFPPMTGPGSFRALQFSKYLDLSGFNTTVLTASKSNQNDEIEDHNLLKQLDSSKKILRISSMELRRVRKLLVKLRLFRLFWFFMYPIFWEQAALWPFLSFSAARREIKKSNINIIYTTSAPFATIILGSMLKLIDNKIIWVADLRDPFTDGYMWRWPSKLHWYVCRIIEHYMIKIPDHIIVPTPTFKDMYIKRNLVREDRISVITNGFDES